MPAKKASFIVSMKVSVGLSELMSRRFPSAFKLSAGLLTRSLRASSRASLLSSEIELMKSSRASSGSLRDAR